MEKTYAAIAKAMDLKVGDRVKVAFKVPDRVMGWCNIWPNGMDSCVGKCFTITRFDCYGVHLDCPLPCGFPHFCLEKQQPIEHTISIDGKRAVTLSEESYQALKAQLTD